MDPAPPATTDASAAPPLRWRRSARHALRHGWDALGLVCGVSLTVFGAGLLPAAVFFSASRISVLGFVLGGLTAAAALGPLFAGASVIAFRLATFEETAYGDLWSGAARLFKRSLAVAGVQLGVWILLGSNLLYYTSRGGTASLLASVTVLYLSAFWALNCLYHWPLLAATDAGHLAREDGASGGLKAVFRGAALLAVGAPFYGLAVLLTALALGVLFTVSGVGLALLGAGSVAVLSAQCVVDLLVRFGAIEPLPDVESPVADEVWRMRG